MRIGEERTERTERDIVAVFREQLGDLAIESADDDFGQGGDRLSVLLVFGELQNVLGATVGVNDLFGHPSARELARHLALQATDIPDGPPSSEDGPETECDPRLVELTRAVLEVALGPDDDFFTVDGDSRAAERLVSLARAAGLELGVGQVIELRTSRQQSRGSQLQGFVMPSRPGRRRDAQLGRQLTGRSRHANAQTGKRLVRSSRRAAGRHDALGHSWTASAKRSAGSAGATGRHPGHPSCPRTPSPCRRSSHSDHRRCNGAAPADHWGAYRPGIRTTRSGATTTARPNTGLSTSAPTSTSLRDDQSDTAWQRRWVRTCVREPDTSGRRLLGCVFAFHAASCASRPTTRRVGRALSL